MSLRIAHSKLKNDAPSRDEPHFADNLYSMARYANEPDVEYPEDLFCADWRDKEAARKFEAELTVRRELKRGQDERYEPPPEVLRKFHEVLRMMKRGGEVLRSCREVELSHTTYKVMKRWMRRKMRAE